jgi:DNA-binding CsgD family transcriptional regulator
VLSLDTPPSTCASPSIREVRVSDIPVSSRRSHHTGARSRKASHDGVSERRQKATQSAESLLSIASSYSPEVLRCLSEALLTNIAQISGSVPCGDLNASPTSNQDEARLAKIESIEKNARRPLRLTLCESRVAELVSQGLSLREVAATLFISVKTADFHLQSVYRKLDVHTRGEFASAFFRLKAAA